MTLSEALAKSTTGIAIRKYNDSFRMAGIVGPRIYTFHATGVFEHPFPGPLEDWEVLLPGATADRIWKTIHANQEK